MDGVCRNLLSPNMNVSGTVRKGDQPVTESANASDILYIKNKNSLQ